MNRLAATTMLFIFILFSVFPATAADSPDDFGMAVRVEKISGNAKPASEDTSITLGYEKCGVKSIFEFHNPGTDPVRLEAGFPLSYEDELEGINVTIDGEPAPLYRSKGARMKNNRSIDIYWSFWKMDIGPGKTRKVEAVYAVQPWGETELVHCPYRSHRTAVWQEFTDNKWTFTPEVNAVLEAIVAPTTGYALRGSSWGASVRSMTVSVAHESMKGMSIRSYRPEKGAKLTRDGLTWTFRNSRPADVLFVEYNPSMPLDKEIVVAEKAVKLNPNSKSLKAYRDYLLKLSAKF